MASQIKAKTCHHIKANGTCCKSPALTNEDYCYFHTAQRQRMRRQRRVEHKSLHAPLVLPLLEDAESIQIAIGDVLNALIIGRIDHKTAGLLLYGLQTAASNIRQAKFAVAADQAESPASTATQKTSCWKRKLPKTSHKNANAKPRKSPRCRKSANASSPTPTPESPHSPPKSPHNPLPKTKAALRAPLA